MSGKQRSTLFSDSSSEDEGDEALEFKRRKRTNSGSATTSPTSPMTSGSVPRESLKPIGQVVEETHNGSQLRKPGFNRKRPCANWREWPGQHPNLNRNERDGGTSAAKADKSDPKILMRQCKSVMALTSSTKTMDDPLFDSPVKLESKTNCKLVNDPLEFRKGRLPRDFLSEAEEVCLTEEELKKKEEAQQQRKQKARLEFELAIAKKCLDEKEDQIDGIRNGCSSSASSSQSEIQQVEWNFYSEKVTAEESIHWIVPGDTKPLDLSILIAGRKTGEKNHVCLEADSEKIISSHLRKQLLEVKEDLSKLDHHAVLGARVRSNPFETLRHGIFMNRAALKMANIDAVLGFSLTTPKTQTGLHVLRPPDLFYFGDVCGGPGGFSEYLLWRKGWEAKGFGFTLRNCDCDFNISDFIVGGPESFDVNYGSNDTGDILDPVNVTSFTKYVLKNTDGLGVHLMVADGGFEVEDKRLQEIESKNIYLAQFLVALAIIRPGGHFVCKVFDIMTKFSVSLIWLLYSSFDLIAIHKPNASRPANSERYIICKWKRDWTQTHGAFKYLTECHEMLWNYSQNEKLGKRARDILELVSLDLLIQKDDEFYQYIRRSNDIWASKQILALQKIKGYYGNNTLIEHRQKGMRENCLELWGIPDEPRPRKIDPLREKTSDRFNEFRKSYAPGLFASHELELTIGLMAETFKSPYDWRCMIVGATPVSRYRGFYFSMGLTRVFRFEQYLWKSVPFSLELTRDTCVYGEFVSEVSKSSKTKRTAFHIIDAMVLGGKDVRHIHYIERHEMCTKFAKAMNKPSCPDLLPVRCKKLIKMEHIPAIFEKLVYHQLKPENKAKPGSSLMFPIEMESDSSDYMLPTGLLFLKLTMDPWTMALSRSAGKKYFFDTGTRVATFQIPQAAIADFRYTIEHRILWSWDSSTRLSVVNSVIDDPTQVGKVQANHITSHVANLLTYAVTPQNNVHK